jgi:hypothetical protein
MDMQLFLGWMLVIHICLLVLSIIMIAVFPRSLWKISHYFIPLSMEEYNRINAMFIGLYKLLILFFLMVPYIVLYLDLI